MHRPYSAYSINSAHQTRSPNTQKPFAFLCLVRTMGLETLKTVLPSKSKYMYMYVWYTSGSRLTWFIALVHLFFVRVHACIPRSLLVPPRGAHRSKFYTPHRFTCITSWRSLAMSYRWEVAKDFFISFFFTRSKQNVWTSIDSTTIISHLWLLVSWLLKWLACHRK